MIDLFSLLTALLGNNKQPNLNYALVGINIKIKDFIFSE